MNYLVAILALISVTLLSPSAVAQVLSVDDPIVNYNPDRPPATPRPGVMVKWVRTPEATWNSSRWKSYFLNGVAFRLRFPNNYNPQRAEKYPMVVILHGLGFRTGTIYMNDRHLTYAGAEAYEEAINRGRFDGFVLSPQSTSGWFNEHHIGAVNAFIDQAKDQVNLNVDRVSVSGRSAAAQQVWLFIQRSSRTYAAALPLSGVKSSSADNIDAYKHLPVWVFQGAQDNSPHPSLTENVIQQIVAKGGNVTYTKFKQGGHAIFDASYAEPDYFSFLERVHKANPTVYDGAYASVYDDNEKVVYQFLTKEQPCPGQPLRVRMGVTAGFNGYEWRRNGRLIVGATKNTYTATSLGKYEARFRRGSVWSDWSPQPVVVKRRPTTHTPDIQVAGLASRVLPTPGSQSSVPLELPQGFASYEWRRVADNRVVSTQRVYQATQPGDYVGQVIETLGCTSKPSRPFTVVNAQGANGPASPQNVRGTVVSLTNIKISWSATSGDPHPPTGYELYRSTTPDRGYSLVALISGSGRSFTDTGLKPGGAYHYRLRAVNGQGASSSTRLTVATQTDKEAPSAPAGLTAKNTTSHSVSLDWQAAKDNLGVTRYDVYRNGVRAFSTEESQLIVYNLRPDTPYEFAVKARDQAGNQSGFSNRVRVTLSSKGNSNPPAKSAVKVNFNVTDSQGAPWNNTNAVPDPGQRFTGLKNGKNHNTGIGFEIVAQNPTYSANQYGFSGDNPFGMVTGNNSGVVPDNVMRSTYWLDPGRTAELRFFGLDLSQRYTFRFFASRSGDGNRTSVYRVNGRSVKLNAANNTKQMVSLSNVSPNDRGEVVVTITSDAGALYSYIGAIIVEWSDAASNTRQASPVAKNLKAPEIDAIPSQVTVYPNPHNGTAPLYLDLTGPDDVVTVQVHSTRGDMVYETHHRLSDGMHLTLDGPTSQLKRGLYIVRVSGVRFGTHVKRLLKQ